MTTVGYRVEISCVRPQIPQLFKSNERTEDKDLEIFLDLYYFIYIYKMFSNFSVVLWNVMFLYVSYVPKKD